MDHLSWIPLSSNTLWLKARPPPLAWGLLWSRDTQPSVPAQNHALLQPAGPGVGAGVTRKNRATVCGGQRRVALSLPSGQETKEGRDREGAGDPTGGWAGFRRGGLSGAWLHVTATSPAPDRTLGAAHVSLRLTGAMCGRTWGQQVEGHLGQFQAEPGLGEAPDQVQELAGVAEAEASPSSSLQGRVWG